MVVRIILLTALKGLKRTMGKTFHSLESLVLEVIFLIHLQIILFYDDVVGF